MNLKLILWLGSILTVFALLFGVYRYGRHVEALGQDKVRAAAVIAQQKQDQQELLNYIDNLKSAEVQHDKDIHTIGILRHQLDGVSVHIPCDSITSGNPQAGTSTNRGTGTLSAGVDEAFGRLQAGVSSLVERCDQLNIDAIRRNTEVK